MHGVYPLDILLKVLGFGFRCTCVYLTRFTVQRIPYNPGCVHETCVGECSFFLFRSFQQIQIQFIHRSIHLNKKICSVKHSTARTNAPKQHSPPIHAENVYGTMRISIRYIASTTFSHRLTMNPHRTNTTI